MSACANMGSNQQPMHPAHSSLDPISNGSGTRPKNLVKEPAGHSEPGESYHLSKVTHAPK